MALSPLSNIVSFTSPKKPSIIRVIIRAIKALLRWLFG